MKFIRALLISGIAFLPFSAAADTFLLMAEEEGCVWCAQWNREISAIYPKTPEGRSAPLRRYDIHSDAPEGIKFDSRVRFTPTFILVRDGEEVGRIEGYPGEDFFWGLLAMMLDRADIDYEGTG